MMEMKLRNWDTMERGIFRFQYFSPNLNVSIWSSSYLRKSIYKIYRITDPAGLRCFSAFSAEQ
jgi:hypothetical protein